MYTDPRISKQSLKTKMDASLPHTTMTSSQIVFFVGLAAVSTFWLHAQTSFVGLDSDFTASAELGASEHTGAENTILRNNFPTDRENTVPVTESNGDLPFQRNNFPSDRDSSVPVTIGNGDLTEHTAIRNNFKYF